MKRDLYTEVAQRILAELEAGAVPWVKPWSALPGIGRPVNAATGRYYSGCNVILLWMAAQSAGWITPRFLTFKQAQELGGSVKKGANGTRIYFVKPLVVTLDETADESDTARTITMLREYTVFNVAQCDGLPAHVVAPPVRQTPAPNKDTRDPLIDQFLAVTNASLQDGAATYSPSRDVITMPAFEAFTTAAVFYATIFHELGHWTGHVSRLARFKELVRRYDRQAYALEELIAELTSAFLCAEFDLDGDLRHAGYIADWIRLLKSEPHAFFTAASKAQAAADFLRGLALAEPIDRGMAVATKTSTTLTIMAAPDTAAAAAWLDLEQRWLVVDRIAERSDS